MAYRVREIDLEDIITSHPSDIGNYGTYEVERKSYRRGDEYKDDEYKDRVKVEYIVKDIKEGSDTISGDLYLQIREVDEKGRKLKTVFRVKVDNLTLLNKEMIRYYKRGDVSNDEKELKEGLVKALDMEYDKKTYGYGRVDVNMLTDTLNGLFEYLKSQYSDHFEYYPYAYAA